MKIWEGFQQELFGETKSPVLVLEIGCGREVRSCRDLAERVVRDGGFGVRVNPEPCREWGVWRSSFWDWRWILFSDSQVIFLYSVANP